MEDQIQYTNAPQITNIQKPHSHNLLWVVIVLLLVAGIGASISIYYWQHKKLVSYQNSLNEASNKIATFETKEKLYALPTKTDLSPTCESGNNDDLIIASLTPEPIEQYQVYAVKCANSTSAPTEIIAFKVHEDGTRTFAYGAGTGEPFCISNKIIDATAAKAISEKTLVPICNTF